MQTDGGRRLTLKSSSSRPTLISAVDAQIRLSETERRLSSTPLNHKEEPRKSPRDTMSPLSVIANEAGSDEDRAGLNILADVAGRQEVLPPERLTLIPKARDAAKKRSHVGMSGPNKRNRSSPTEKQKKKGKDGAKNNGQEDLLDILPTFRMVLLMDAYIACRGDNRNDWRSHIPTQSERALRRQFKQWNPEFFNQFRHIPGRGCGGFIPAW